MINLFERYNEESKLLFTSLKQAGYTQQTIFLEETGFLPIEATSPYAFFLQQAGAKFQGKPLYFNQLRVPPYWEIKGSLGGARVTNYNKTVAVINYEKNVRQERIIASVAWQDAQGEDRLIEYYNRYGWCFKKTLYISQGQPLKDIYQTDTGLEVISYDRRHQTIVLHYHGQTYFFDNQVNFIKFFLAEAGYRLDKIWYNTLSIPMFTVTNLGEEGTDTLFWQEGVRSELPGNMEFLLRSFSQRKTKICFTQKDAYDSFIKLVEPKEKKRLSYVGYLYKYYRENRAQKHALIMTNSDQVAHLQELVEQLPDLTFHIAALTEMSTKLMFFDKYSNVKLYPNVNSQQINELWQLADYYLDINYQSEILTATRQAFLNQMLILGFNETRHTEKLGLDDNRYPVADYQNLIAKLKTLLANPEELNKEVLLQNRAAEQTSVAYYHEILGK